MAGRPKGAENKDKAWRAAIRKAVSELHDSGDGEKAEKIKALTLLARRLVTKALDGDVTALKEIGDRLDGKAVQGVELGGPDGGPVKIEEVSITEAARRLAIIFRAAAEKAENTTSE